MNLLAPLFLAGAALVIGPILFHLIRQAPRNRVVFSSTEFLDPSTPKTEQKSRIQNPWLLLLRCLIVALLALAFARPFLSPDQDPTLAVDLQRDVVIAIDESASMSRTTLWQQAVDAAVDLTSNLSEHDRLAVVVFSDTASTVVSPEQWRDWPFEQRSDLLENLLDQRTPRTLPGKLDLGIETAIQELNTMREISETHGFGEIVVVSDFAQGSALSGLPGLEWPSDSSLRRISIQPVESEQSNVGLRWLGWGETGEGQPLARVALFQSDDEQSISVSLSATDVRSDETLGDGIEVTLEGKTEHLVNLPLPSSAPTVPFRIELAGDGVAFDNKLYVAPDYVPEVPIALLSSNEVSDTEGSSYFASKALSGITNPAVEVTTPTQLDGTEYDGFIIDRPLSSDEASALRGAIENGAKALVLASHRRFDATLDALSGEGGWGVQESQNDDALIGSVDFSHPLFRPFADPRFNNFANIRFWKAPRLVYPESNGVKVLAAFDSGDPLLLESDVGTGKLYVWAGTWKPKETQWPLSTKFVPWLHRFVVETSGGNPLPSNAVFSSRSVPQYSTLEFDSPPRETGIYQAGSRWVAFQLAPEESDTNPILDDAWDRMGMPEFDARNQASRIEQIHSDLQLETAYQAEQRQRLWQWILIAVIALLAVESLIAIRVSKKREVASA